MANKFPPSVLLNTPCKPDANCSWNRVFFVHPHDKHYAKFERWCSHELFWVRNAIFNPFLTVAQSRNDALMRLFHWTLGVDEYMAKTDNTRNNKGSTVPVDFWVNTRLTDDDKQAIQLEQPTIQTILEDFGALVFGGYRLSVAYDGYSKAVQASLVCVDPESLNSGCGVSARHPDLDVALMYLLYKVQKMGDEPWRSFAPPPREDSWG